MKKLILGLGIMLGAISTKAQQQHNQADFPNWVVESNVKTPKQSTIRFYNEKQELIYQEKIEGKKVKIENRKVQNNLNKVLKQLISNERKISDSNLVAAVFNGWK